MLLGIAAYVLVAAVTFVIVAFIDAPYGRHARRGWGPQIPTRLGWIVMESPAIIGPIVIMAAAPPATTSPAAWILLGIWLFHYGYRTLVFPWLIRANGSTMPVVVAALAFVYNVFNAWVNFTWVSQHGEYGWSWLTQPTFFAGLALFVAGFLGHVRSDHILRNLRAPGETGYRIPHGFLFRWVSCPNYFSEIVQWFGWALLAWSPAGLMFAVYTIANLGPRAVAHHQWYRTTFADYPPSRRALVPWVL